MVDHHGRGPYPHGLAFGDHAHDLLLRRVCVMTCLDYEIRLKFADSRPSGRGVTERKGPTWRRLSRNDVDGVQHEQSSAVWVVSGRFTSLI